MSEIVDVLSNYWQLFIVGPIGYLSHKTISLNSRVSVNETKITTLEATCENLCKESQEQTKILARIEGALGEHLRKSSSEP